METLGPWGTATLLCWGPRGDARTSGYCYAGVSRGHGTLGYCCTATLGGPRGDAGTSGYCYTTMLGGPWGDAGPCGAATLGGTLRGRWARGDAGAAGLRGDDGPWETLVTLGWCWSLEGDSRSTDACCSEDFSLSLVRLLK